MRYLAAIAVVTLAGCASYAEMQARPPMFALQSDRSVDQVLGCIAPKWAEFTAPSIVPDGEGKVVSALGRGPEQVMMQASIWPAGEGSTIEYRQAGSISTGTFRRAQEAVRACR